MDVLVLRDVELRAMYLQSQLLGWAQAINALGEQGLHMRGQKRCARRGV